MRHIYLMCAVLHMLWCPIKWENLSKTVFLLTWGKQYLQYMPLEVRISVETASIERLLSHKVRSWFIHYWGFRIKECVCNVYVSMCKYANTKRDSLFYYHRVLLVIIYAFYWSGQYGFCPHVKNQLGWIDVLNCSAGNNAAKLLKQCKWTK